LNSKDSIALADYRLQVHTHYADARNSDLTRAESCKAFRKSRDELIGNHSQSALSPAQKKAFTKLDYFTYDPSWRFLAEVDEDPDSEILEIPLKEDGLFRLRRLGKVSFERENKDNFLTLFWVLGYGGGVFLPFRDTSSLSGATYGGTRYLLDSIKGAYLGQENGKLILDFNYAYNPSCAYNPIWDCPLAPEENWLDISVLTGEKAIPAPINLF